MSRFQPQHFAIALSAWFAKQQRDLPWRETDFIGNPYRVLVSEIMLQQTTVAAVAPFYRRFMARFPDVASLAAAPEDEVLALWAGLGYYSRARNLHKAAKTVVEKHGGTFPTDFEQILALPGVGRYTAGAVASIALGHRAPIVDANVARVLSRVLPVEGDLKITKNQAKLWAAAQQIVDVEQVAPREINPALMELGALICTPKSPRCPLCPVESFCEARAQGRQNELPQLAAKKAPTPMFDACAWCRNESGEVLLRRRPDEEGIWWRGMWELPRVTRAEGETVSQALERLGTELGVHWKVGERLSTVKHGVTRFQIELECRRVTLQNAEAFEPREQLRFFEVESSRELAMPSTMRRLVDKLGQNLGANSGTQLSLLEF